jgi:hypothetical protein
MGKRQGGLAMTRLHPLPLVVLAIVLLLPLGALRADEDPKGAEPPAAKPAAEPPAVAPPKEAPRPPMASDEEAEAALALFKVEFKAKGLKGDEKLAQMDYAMRQLAEVQHPKIVDAIYKITRHKVPEIRTSAVMRLGQQRALPAYAGEHVVKAMRKNWSDETYLMAGLETIGALGYLGAGKVLRELILHSDYAVVKNALVTMGELVDTRFIEDVIKLMKKLKLEKGAKWDGVSVTYDTGAPGTHDQEMAEKIGKAKEAKNRAKGRSAGRSMRDLGPVVLEVAKALTGQEFTGSIAARKWVDENKAHVKKLHDRDEQREKDQKAD